MLGNATADYGYQVERLPRPGETVLADGQSVEPGGKGLNQAVVAARAGASVTFATAIGDDADGAMIRAYLADEGLASSAQRMTRGPTDRSILCTERGGQNFIVSTDRQAKSIMIDDARDLLTALRPGDILLMQGNLSRETTGDALQAAEAAGVRTILNPAPITWDFSAVLKWSRILVVNEVEAETLSGAAEPETAAAILRRRGAGTVIVTLGAAGALLAAETACLIPAPDVQAVDTAGAGDVFVGVLAAAIAEREDVSEACGWAIRAASLSVTRPGTSGAFPTARELQQLRRAPGRSAGTC